jgi:hypothetical protein
VTKAEGKNLIQVSCQSIYYHAELLINRRAPGLPQRARPHHQRERRGCSRCSC